MGIFALDGNSKEKFSISSLLGKGGKCVGDLILSDSIHVTGEVEGSIRAAGEVILEEGSLVTGSVEGRRVVVAGEVVGNVKSHTAIELASTARIKGDIVAEKLIVDEGAMLSGHVETNRASDAAGLLIAGDPVRELSLK